MKESHKVALGNKDFISCLGHHTSRDAMPWSGRQGIALVTNDKGDINECSN